MHVIHPPPAGVSLFSSTGLVRKFASKKDAVNALGRNWISQNVGAHFRYARESHRYYTPDAYFEYRYEFTYTVKPYIMRDDAGAPLTLSDFHGLNAGQNRSRAASRNVWATWNGFGPVPRTGRPRNYRQFRRPGTHTIRRDTPHFSEEGEPKVRGKRSAAGIPTAWDDRSRSDIEDRSWKRHRKTQWKPI